MERNILEGHGTSWNMVERCGSNKEVEHTWTVYDVHVGVGIASVRSADGKGHAPYAGSSLLRAPNVSIKGKVRRGRACGDGVSPAWSMTSSVPDITPPSCRDGVDGGERRRGK